MDDEVLAGTERQRGEPAPSASAGAERAHLFISHATSDHASADRLCRDLEADGIKCWLAPRDIDAGDDYARAIVQAIDQTGVLLLVLSQSACASPHVEREVHLAAGVRKPIVPVRLEPVELSASLRYLLANAQWIDAPRLEPHLATIRREVRELLRKQGRVLPASRRRPFHRVLTSVGTWAAVLGITALAARLIQDTWFNLVPLHAVPLAAVSRAPALFGLMLLPVVVALGLQYWSHRNLARVATLDALFAVSGSRAARMRAAGAVAVAGALGVAGGMQAPAVSIALEQGPLDRTGAELVLARRCAGDHYVQQSSTYFVVRLRVGAYNPPGPYALRVELAPYGTDDGVEFCEIRLDERLGVTRVGPVLDPEQQSAFMGRTDGDVPSRDVTSGPVERFQVSRPVAFTIAHYRDAEPSDRCTIKAYLLVDGVARSDALQTIPTCLWTGC